jgi:SAM-dependent methyltransferase
MFKDVIDIYRELEPPGIDRWNPLGNDLELWHRVRLFLALEWALRQVSIPISEAKVLDVGCGVGRSTRLLLEFGVKPENILGIDLRSSAISYAQVLNPAISFQVVDDVDDWPFAGRVDICMQCTVFSSIAGDERRRQLATMMERTVHHGGFLIWWDSVRANSFAGQDKLKPQLLFQDSTMISSREFSLRPSVSEAVKYRGKKAHLLIDFLQHMVGFAPTHCVALFRKDGVN